MVPRTPEAMLAINLPRKIPISPHVKKNTEAMGIVRMIRRLKLINEAVLGFPRPFKPDEQSSEIPKKK